MPDSFSSAAFRDALVLDPDVRYMNIGTSGPWPRESLQAQIDALTWMSRRGPGSAEAYRWYLEAETGAREGFASFFGGKPEQYVLTQNTSEGINIVLNGFPWQPGDEIVTTDLEHCGLALPVYHQVAQSEKGLNLNILQLLDGADVVESFEAALTPRTRLLAISHIAYCDGRLLPIPELVERAHAAGVAVLLDAAQSAGQFPVRWDEIGADFVTFPGQKWLLGPEGTGGLYLHGDWVTRLRPDRVGWSGEAGFDMEGHYKLKETGARFEVATRDPAALIALRKSLDFLTLWNPETLANRVREIAATIHQRLTTMPNVEVLGPVDPAEQTALIAFRVGDLSPQKIVAHLLKEVGIIARWIPPPHPPAVRVSCGAFVTDEEVSLLFNALEQLV